MGLNRMAKNGLRSPMSGGGVPLNIVLIIIT